jgi:putative hydrolase of the HAD superfamily
VLVRPSEREQAEQWAAAASPTAARGRFEAVLLDVGGVFHLPAHDRIAPVLARAGLSVPDDLDRAHYVGAAAITDMLSGDQTIWATYQPAYARACGAPDHRLEEIAAAVFAEFQSGGVWSRIVPGSVAALRELAATGVKLAVVSNADGTVEAQLRGDGVCQVGPGPGVPVHAVLDSSVVGVSKPDPRIFKLALEQLDVAPERALHVGDIVAADVDGARAAGITPVLMDPYGLHAELDVLRVRSLREVTELVDGRSKGGAIGW